MLRLITMFAASGVYVDQFTDALIATNVLHSVTAPGFPVLIPRLCVVGMFRRDPIDPPDVDVQLTIQEGATEVFKDTMRLQFAELLSARTVFFIGGFAITKPGDLEITLQAGEVKASYVIDVQQIARRKAESDATATEPAKEPARS